MDAAQIFAEVFPVAAGPTSLELVDTRDGADGGLIVTVRLVVWDRPEGGEPTIRDIKEQEVHVLGAPQREDPRLATCVAGWAEAVRHVFEQAGGDADCWMPHDLIVVGSLLTLKRPRTAADFTDAALAGKQRLGRLLPDEG